MVHLQNCTIANFGKPEGKFKSNKNLKKHSAIISMAQVKCLGSGAFFTTKTHTLHVLIFEFTNFHELI